MGENLRVVWAEFFTLSWGSFAFLEELHTANDANQNLKLKTRPRFCPASLSLSMVGWFLHKHQLLVDIWGLSVVC
jgi:hypothetical protein